MLSVLLRRAAPLLFAAIIGQAASADTLPPYQTLAERQVCNAGQILSEPGGAVLRQEASGTKVSITDLVSGKDGRLYYRLAGADRAFVATGDAPHFCGFVGERQAELRRFRALPNACHLIAASRKTLDEVNSFAAQNPDFLTGMAVFRAENGWLAISLGQVTLAAAPSILANSENIPADAYCSDGAGYVAMMDLQNGQFVEPDGTSLRGACLGGNASACRDEAGAIAGRPELADGDYADLWRLRLIGCGAGDVLACDAALNVPTRIAAHPLVTTWPAGAGQFSSPKIELARIGCDAGLLTSCQILADSELVSISGDPGKYLSALQALAAGCVASQDQYACRDMFRLLQKLEKAMSTPASADLLFHLAGLRAPSCRVPTTQTDESCLDLTLTYEALLSRPDITPDQASVALSYLQSRCNGNDPDACAIASRQAGHLDDAARDRAAAQAVAACQGISGNATCAKLDQHLGTALPETMRRRLAAFDELAAACRAGNTPEAANSCSEVLVYFAREISATKMAPVEATLQAACTPEIQSGCNMLAFFYGPSDMTGEDLFFQGRNQPEKRLAALRTGCHPGVMGLASCNQMGEMLAEAGDQTGAQASYRMACDTIRDDQGRSWDVKGDGGCFNAGLHALRKLNDRATAKADFDYVCKSPHDSNRPYACKHLALMTPDNEPVARMRLLEQGCYPEGEFMGDGEACLYLGRMLLDQRDALVWQDGARFPEINPDAVSDDQGLILTANTASQAFSSGCLNRWDAACAANEALLKDWVAGTYPQEAATCQIRDAAGVLQSEKSCRMIAYVVPERVEYEAGNMHPERMFLWPDGDRTVVRDSHPALLNGRPSAFYVSDDGLSTCQRNPETGNSFCIPGTPEE
ncbi:hypothetical protein IQ24_03112 [Paracoccus sulfuroxidans]|uniref:Beta-lactamase n=1 Tax=Paracoccus sulfuroxidans TaxID=384678 RepID=A0A562NGM8_9RHOB|nr:hypothetical protein IQ24_03112 [Paracoccus sulfuroxidans]